MFLRFLSVGVLLIFLIFFFFFWSAVVQRRPLNILLVQKSVLFVVKKLVYWKQIIPASSCIRVLSNAKVGNMFFRDSPYI